MTQRESTLLEAREGLQRWLADPSTPHDSLWQDVGILLREQHEREEALVQFVLHEVGKMHNYDHTTVLKAFNDFCAEDDRPERWPRQRRGERIFP